MHVVSVPVVVVIVGVMVLWLGYLYSVVVVVTVRERDRDTDRVMRCSWTQTIHEMVPKNFQGHSTVIIESIPYRSYLEEGCN